MRIYDHDLNHKNMTCFVNHKWKCSVYIFQYMGSQLRASTQQSVKKGNWNKNMDDSLVLCVGLVCIDNFFVVDRYPKEDTDQPASQAFKACGGNAANNCTVLAQFLPNVTFLGTLPKPTYGNQYDFVINNFRNNGVKVSEDCPVRHGSEWPGKYVFDN